MLDVRMLDVLEVVLGWDLDTEVLGSAVAAQFEVVKARPQR
jgi:hypothetical protein